MANICFTRLCITLWLRVLQLLHFEDILHNVSNFPNPDIDNRVDESVKSVCLHICKGWQWKISLEGQKCACSETVLAAQCLRASSHCSLHTQSHCDQEIWEWFYSAGLILRNQKESPQRAGAHLLWGRAKRVEAVKPEEDSRETLYCGLSILKGGLKERRRKTF